MPTKTRKPGRPKLAKGQAKGKILPVRVNPEDMKAFTKAARASEHKTLSGWIRHTLRTAANGTKDMHAC